MNCSQPNRMWDDGAFLGACVVLTGGDSSKFSLLKDNSPFERIQCMQVYRLQVPHTLNFITRLVYYSELLANQNPASQFKCCQNSNRIKWTPLNDIVPTGSKLVGLWGPEVVDFCTLIQQPIMQSIQENRLNFYFLSLLTLY